MKTSPDFYDGDQLLSQMTLVKMMDTLFAETALAAADGNQPMFSLENGNKKGFFSRNLITCFLLELRNELEKRDDTNSHARRSHVRNGKLVLPLAAGGIGGGAAMACDGVGVSEAGDVGDEGGAS